MLELADTNDLNGLDLQNRILADISQNKKTDIIFQDICRWVEALLPHARCSILLLDRKLQTLVFGAAPSLPDSYNQLVDGISIGPNVGSCGSSAFHRKRIIASDIAEDERWSPFRDIARRYELASCWSEPILNSNGDTVGTVALYHRVVHSPSPTEIAIGQSAAGWAGLALQMKTHSDVQVRESEERIRYILENTPACVFIKDAEGRYEFVNNTTAKVLGESRENILGRRDIDFVSEEKAFAWRDEDLTVLKTGRPIRTQASIPISDGVHDYVVVKFPLKLSGQAPALCGIATDISDIRRLERREEQLLSVLDQSLDLIALATSEGQGLYLNAYGRSLLGLEPDFDITMLNIADIIFPSDQQRLEAATESILREGHGSGEAQFRHCKTGQAIPIEWSAVAVTDPVSQQLIGFGTVARDLTEFKRTQKLLEHQAAELRRSNQDLEQFAYAASHDLKEPLRMVVSYLKLLERDHLEKLDQSGKDFLGFAKDGAQRMSRLIDSLLKYAKAGGQALKHVRIDSRRVVDEAIANLILRIEESDAAIQVDALPELEVDPVLLTQVFQNILSNAIKFRQHGRAPRIKISADKRQDEWVFAISDNGIGMSAKESEIAFDLFRRFHPLSEVPGEGIGLATTKRIIERHGGKIWVESTTGNGSTFFFSIPESKRTETRQDPALGTP